MRAAAAVSRTAARPWTRNGLGRERTTSSCCEGTTEITAEAATWRTRCLLVRTSSVSGECGSTSATTASTIPCTPPVTVKPTLFATQYRVTGDEAEKLRLWRRATAIEKPRPRPRRCRNAALHSFPVTAIAQLEENRTVDGVYAVAKKERLRTRAGAPYLALELVDPSGRIPARVWSDVELLDGRFAEGDAVRVLGRVERYRDRLQLDVRTLEPATDVDPAAMAPALRRDPEELEGFLEFLVAEIHDDGLRALVARALADAPLRAYPATPDGHHSYAGGLLEHTVGVATICRELGQLHPRLRADLLLAAALVHDLGRTRELGPPPSFAPTEDGRLLGHVHLGLRALEELGAPAELLHAVSCHHDARAARTAEAAVLYHANQLDAVAATRPVPQ